MSLFSLVGFVEKIDRLRRSHTEFFARSSGAWLRRQLSSNLILSSNCTIYCAASYFVSDELWIKLSSS
jgi:hypothetical protein